MFAIVGGKMGSDQSEGGEFTVIWSRPDRAGKGPAPSHSRAEITAAAVALADAEGIEAVSMRRIAAALGSGTTTLYRYLSRKEDLLDLMADAVEAEGELVALTGDWRTDLRRIAYRSRATILRHPWMATLAGGRPSMGPSSLAVAEHTLAAIDHLGLAIDDMLILVGTLEAFVRGYAIAELAQQEAIRRSGVSMQQWMHAHSPYIRSVIDAGQHPLVTRVVLDAELPHAEDGDERGFSLGLEHVLDGLAANLVPAG